MHTQDYRRRNLAAALELKGVSRAELSRMAECPPPHISMLLKGPRPFGHDLARKFESLLALRQGWLDEEVPLTDKAIEVARTLQLLSESHQREVNELVVVLKAIEEHQDEAKLITRQSEQLTG